MEKLSYKKPRQNRQRSSSLRPSRNCSLRSGAIGTMKIMKSVTMFMEDVRYQTGRE
jgi:hypothetical protein